MAFNVSALPEYVDQSRMELIGTAFLDGKTASLVNLEVGVNQKTSINLIETAAVLQNGSTCSWTPQGDVELTQRYLEPVFVKVNMSLCDKDLLKKYASHVVTMAAGKETLPFEATIMDEITKSIAEQIEKKLWQGDTGLNFKGYLDILGTDGTVDDRASVYALQAIKTVYNKLDPAIVMKEDTVIFVGEDDYRAFIQDLVAANLYHFAPDYKEGEYVLPGTSVRVIAVAGLTGTSAVVGGQLSNFFYGVDAADDAQTLDVWYSKDAREFRIAAGFSMAAQIARPDMVAVIKNADKEKV